jgi:GrpB-like predicted nucleotidyltransferase (UPF0157 family)
VTELDEPVHLCAYDPRWASLFASEARRIAAEHIGSTSVPGLLAKPIIDVMLGVGPSHSVDSMRAALAALGYEDMGEAGVPGRLYFRRRAKTAFNIALVVRGGSIWIANIALRNYLRTNADAAREYAETKRSACESGAHSLLAYSDYKSEVVARLISRALAPDQ